MPVTGANLRYTDVICAKATLKNYCCGRLSMLRAAIIRDLDTLGIRPAALELNSSEPECCR
jgi:hypothetical protein